MKYRPTFKCRASYFYIYIFILFSLEILIFCAHVIVHVDKQEFSYD